MLASHENYGWTLRSLSFEFLFSGLKSAKRRNFKRVFFPDFSFFKVNQAVMYLLTFAILYIALFFQFRALDKFPPPQSFVFQLDFLTEI